MSVSVTTALLLFDERLSRERRQGFERTLEQFQKNRSSFSITHLDRALNELEAIDVIREKHPNWVFLPWYRALQWHRLMHEEFHPSPLFFGYFCEPLLRYELSRPEIPLQTTLLSAESLEWTLSDLTPPRDSPTRPWGPLRFDAPLPSRSSAIPILYGLLEALRLDPQHSQPYLTFKSCMGRVASTTAWIESWIQTSKFQADDADFRFALSCSPGGVTQTFFFDATPSKSSSPALQDEEFLETFFSPQSLPNHPLQGLQWGADYIRWRIAPNRKTWLLDVFFRSAQDQKSEKDPRVVPDFSFQIIAREQILQLYKTQASHSQPLPPPRNIPQAFEAQDESLKAELIRTQNKIKELIHGGLGQTQGQLPPSRGMTPHLEPEALLDALDTQLLETLPQLRTHSARIKRLIQRLELLVNRLKEK